MSGCFLGIIPPTALPIWTRSFASGTNDPHIEHNGKSATTRYTIGERTLIMGVLNVTPDSFSDGGRYLDPDAAAARAMEMEQQGADIIDIGAESTRPGSERINAGEELRRLVPVLKG